MSDPKRLLDDRDFGDRPRGDLQDLLAAGKSELPDDRQLAMLAAKIGIAGGLGGAGAAGAAGGSAGGAKAAVAATSAKVGLGLKIAGAVAVASAVGTGAVVVAKQAEPTPAPAGLVATVASTTTIAVQGTTPRDPSPSEISPPPSEPSANVRVKQAAPPARGFDAEVALLTRAQTAARTNPTEALALCDELARDFPNGALVQEREVIAIEALAKTGRIDDARARAARFKSRFPGSSHARRIDAIVSP